MSATPHPLSHSTRYLGQALRRLVAQPRRSWKIGIPRGDYPSSHAQKGSNLCTGLDRGIVHKKAIWNAKLTSTALPRDLPDTLVVCGIIDIDLGIVDAPNPGKAGDSTP